jgi:hypothetical protein
MFRTLVKLTGSLGAMLGANDHQHPAIPGNCEQSSWQLNLVFAHSAPPGDPADLIWEQERGFG